MLALFLFGIHVGRKPRCRCCSTFNAFSEVLATFCFEKFGKKLHSESLLVLDSSTSQNFSKYVIVKQVGPIASSKEHRCGSSSLSFAFQSSAQVGMFVSMFVAYADARRKQCLEDVASKLFVLHSRSAQEVCIVDTSVYSCNRCFRILYSSKLGKQHALLPQCGFAAGSHPALHLLESLASCVPVAVELAPQHFGLQSPRQSVRGSHALSMPDVGISDLGDGQHLDVRIGGRSLVWKHLSDAWDITRRKHEHVSGMKACRIRQAVQVGTQFVVVTLCDDRFCLCKGA